MKTAGITLLTALIKLLIFFLYVGVRASKSILPWVSIPSYKEWQDIEGNEAKTKQFQLDTVQLLATVLVVVSFAYVGWWLALLEILAILTLIIVLFIKYLPPGER
jgi:hypothetical protein